jgi:hypothetical protein
MNLLDKYTPAELAKKNYRGYGKKKRIKDKIRKRVWCVN